MSIAQDTAGAVRDGKSKAMGAASAVADQASQTVSDVAGRVKDAGTQAAGYVRDQYEHLSEGAQEAYDRARSQARDWEQSAEGYVQKRPFQALLIAAGVGVLLGLLWKRHD